MKITERDVQNAIVEALLYDGWMILRINQGGRHGLMVCPECNGDGKWPKCSVCDNKGHLDSRYIRFAWWQALGMDQQDSGIADVIADKQVDEVLYYQEGVTGEFIPYDKEVCIHLAIECKAPGKGKRLKRYIENPLIFSDDEHKLKGREKNQAKFLRAVQDHGGTAIVADCLEDIKDYLERIEAQ